MTVLAANPNDAGDMRCQRVEKGKGTQFKDSIY